MWVWERNNEDEENRVKNVLYYQHILRLGGTTTYEYELIKKYCKKKDITLYYKSGDNEQIERFSKLCRVVKWNGEEVKCDAFFTNYEFDSNVLDKFKAKKYYQVIHAMYITNKVKPKLDKRFNAYVCVSEIAKKEFKELTNVSDDKLLVSHNPLTISKEEAKPRLLIGFFTRLSWEKGYEQIKRLIERLDDRKVNYLCIIYTNDACNIKSDNVLVHKAIVNDTRSVIATMDIVGQLSKCEGDNYTTKEAKMCGCKILCTDLECFRENKVIGEDDIVMNYDLSNIDEVVDKIEILAKQKASRLSQWKPIEDIYDTLLVNGESKYKYEREKKMKVKFMVDIARGCTFSELGNAFVPKGQCCIIEKDTAIKGEQKKYGHIVEEIKDEEPIKVVEPRDEIVEDEPKEEKKETKKKATTKKAKK